MARQHLVEALQIGKGLLAVVTSWGVVSAMALITAELGNYERAIELYAFGSRYPFMANTCMTEDLVGKHISEIAGTLPPDIVAEAKARGRARNPDDTIAEIVAELNEEINS